MVKQWDAMHDSDIRPTHRALDGQIRETDKPFESSSGRKARYPGDFGDPAEDCNCRCVALTHARWELDASELQTLKDRAKFFGLDKTDSFKDFEKKYLKAAETVENTGKSGIIKGKKSAVLDAISSGEVSKTVNAAKQNRHMRNSTSYIPGRSYMLAETVAEVQQVIDELHGTGEPVLDGKGNWVHKERVRNASLIGAAVTMDGNETESHVGMIVYSKTGAHMYPIKESEEQ